MRFAQCPRPDRSVGVALLPARPHHGESLQAYANVTAPVGIRMRYPNRHATAFSFFGGFSNDGVPATSSVLAVRRHYAAWGRFIISSVIGGFLGRLVFVTRSYRRITGDHRKAVRSLQRCGDALRAALLP